MKHIIIKLSFLFVTMSVLTSSKEDTRNNTDRSLNDKHTCLQKGDEYAINISCKQTTAVKEKTVEAYTPAMEDSEISLSPISRFILLQ